MDYLLLVHTRQGKLAAYPDEDELVSRLDPYANSQTWNDTLSSASQELTKSF